MPNCKTVTAPGHLDVGSVNCALLATEDHGHAGHSFPPDDPDFELISAVGDNQNATVWEVNVLDELVPRVEHFANGQVLGLKVRLKQTGVGTRKA